jgi:hypothetical protein
VSRCQQESRPKRSFAKNARRPWARACVNCGAQLSVTAKFAPRALILPVRWLRRHRSVWRAGDLLLRTRLQSSIPIAELHPLVRYFPPTTSCSPKRSGGRCLSSESPRRSEPVRGWKSDESVSESSSPGRANRAQTRGDGAGPRPGQEVCRAPRRPSLGEEGSRSRIDVHVQPPDEAVCRVS